MLRVGRVAIFFLTMSLALTAVHSFATDVGNYRISERVGFAGTTVEPGLYNVQIVEGDEGSYIHLSKNGQVVAKDLAIVIRASGTVSNPQVQIAKIVNQEFLRIRIRYSDSWYYAYLKRL